VRVNHESARSRQAYRPINYPWALEYWRKQQQVHWLVEEIPMHSDVKDWNHVLSPGEKNLLTQLFRFFVQGDVDVATGYLDKLIPVLGGQPEVKMMMTGFANMETVHIDAYDKLLQTIGMPDVEYKPSTSIGKWPLSTSMSNCSTPRPKAV
jgi:ribonucleoside-diphosphate reductase beta chain